MSLRICLLGGCSLFYGETPVTGVNTARLQSLLAYLVLHRDAPQLRYHLAFLFWPDSTEAQARTNLRKLLHDLRQALPEADLFLEVDVQTVHWRAGAPFSLDVADFESAVVRADQAEQAGEPASLRAALEQAVALYQGDLLPSCYDDWIQDERERLSQAFAGALERLMLLLESQREYRAAIGHAQHLLRHDPLHEATYRRLMRLYALSGDRAGALRTYHACATILQRELGVEPSPATREAYERLVQTEALPVAGSLLSSRSLPLVGREQEWVQLQKSWRIAAAGAPNLVLLTGEAGIGKTRFAEELLVWAERQGIATASARCYAAEGDLAYGPVAAWLRARPLPSLANMWLSEVARLLPELLAERPDLPVPGPLGEAWQRQRLFEALAHALAVGRQPLLLLLDDLQWCDRDTLEWLHYLLRFDMQARLLVVATLRAEEVGLDHPLPTLLETLRCGDQLTEIEVGPLNETETLSLAEAVAGRRLDPALAAPLYQGSEGSPLFVVEMTRAGLSTGEPWSGEHGQVMTWAGLRSLPRVQAVIEARLAQLSPPARELVGVAATIGREFTFAALARASEGDEDSLVRGLDELWRRRIVREHGADAYDFGHDKIREVAYERLSATRRRALHRRVAQALEAVYVQDLDPVSAQVAAHYERAGLPEQAIRYYLRAGEAAQRIYANEEAIRYYRRVLALREVLLADLPGESIAVLYERLGDLYFWLTRHDEAREAYGRARARPEAQDRPVQARLLRKTANAWRDHYEYEEALRSYAEAEGALGEAPEAAGPSTGGAFAAAQQWWGEWIETQLDRAQLYYWQNRADVGFGLLVAMQSTVEQYGTPDQRGHFFLTLTGSAFRRDRGVFSEAARGYFRLARVAASESLRTKDSPSTVFQLGFYSLFSGELAAAEEYITTALQQSERTGDISLQARCLTYLTLVCRTQSRVEEVERHASRALEVAGAAGMPEYMGTARANQAWLAWRRGDLNATEAHGCAALALWAQLPEGHASAMLQWTALWPLLSIALHRGDAAGAIDCARAMLHPSQIRLPGELEGLLENAIQAAERNDPAQARELLDQAIACAGRVGQL